jgi:hypothetical protein
MSARGLQCALKSGIGYRIFAEPILPNRFVIVLDITETKPPTKHDDADAAIRRQRKRNQRASKRMLARLHKYHPERETPINAKACEKEANLEKPELKPHHHKGKGGLARPAFVSLDVV